MKKVLKIGSISILGLCVLIILGLQIGLNSRLVTNAIDEFAATNIDGRLTYSRVRFNIFEDFRNLGVTLEDVALTYPHSRYAEYDDLDFIKEGRGEAEDTLAAFDRLHLRVDKFAIVASKLRVSELSMEGLHAYPKIYGKDIANWNLFGFAATEDAEDTGSDAPFNLMRVIVDELSVKNAAVRFAELQSGISAALDLPSFVAEASFKAENDTIYIDDFLAKFESRVKADVGGEIITDAALEFDVDAKGKYMGETLPAVNLCLRIPESKTYYAPLDFNVGMLLDVDANIDGKQVLNADIHEFKATSPGLDLVLDGTARDLMGDDPEYSLAAELKARIETVMESSPLLAEVFKAKGDFRFAVNARTYQSELVDFKFDRTEISGELTSPYLDLAVPESNLSAQLLNADIRLKSNADGLSLLADCDSLAFDAGEELKANVSGMDNEVLLTKVKDEKSQKWVPRMQIASAGESIYAKFGENRMEMSGADISAAAQRRITGERRGRRGDAGERRRGRRDSPGRVRDADFLRADIDIALDSSITRYLRAWAPSGHIKADSIAFSTPALPLKTRISALHADFTDNTIEIDTIGVSVGTSDLGLQARLSGLRRALIRKGRLEADLHLRSNRFNVNELLAAAELGAQLDESLVESDTYDESFVFDSLDGVEVETAELPLIIVPANLNANVDLMIENVDYSDFLIGPVTTGLKIQNRTVQLTETDVYSDIGRIYANAFYSTQNKNDISAGVDLRLSDITAHDLIELVPSVDSMMPLIRSLYGRLGCEISATTQLDSNMNVIMPSVDGLLRISGEDLEVRDAGDLRKITRLLLFRNKNIGHIDDLHVNALVRDNKLEIFPFELSVDRYSFALRGTQNFDKTMFYHLSVLKSPFLIPFGINIYGTLDNWRFGLGWAKYRNGRVPAYTKQLDSVQVNFAESIRNVFQRGVQTVMRHNELEMSRLDNSDDKSQPDMMTEAESRELEDMLLEQELAAQEEVLLAEVDAIIAESMLDSAKLMDQYEMSIYDENIARKIARLKEKEAKKAAREAKKAAKKAERAARKAARKAA